MTSLAVIGRPVLHSLSPVLFRAAFEALEVEGRYTRLSVDSALEALGLWGALGLTGLHVTAPFKAEMALRVDLSEEAALLEAVNTVVPSPGGGFLGENTDWRGVLGALDEAGLSPAGLRAVVLGAGGAARAAVFALRRGGAAEIAILNRSLGAAEALARRLGGEPAPLAEAGRIVPAADLVIVCLPAGVALEPAWLRPGQVVLDAVYSHADRSQQALRAGCQVVDGRLWLLHQALAGFELLTGLAPGPAAAGMRRALSAADPRSRVAQSTNIAITGLPGAGKSTVTRLVAVGLGLAAVDTDALAVEAAGAPIGDIFASRGEPAFRALERRALSQALGGDGRVVACGGGAVVDAANRAMLHARSLVIWLAVAPEEAARRAADGTRPLLAGRDPADAVRALLARRRDAYAQVADLVIDTTHRSPEQVAERICDEVRRKRPA